MTTDVVPSVDSATQKPSLWAPTAPPFGSTWADFCAWVGWLDTAYEMQLSKCWVLHEGLVHSLSALWHPWRSVYATPAGSTGAPPAHGGPSQWHTSHLYPLRDRLQRSDGAPGAGCRNREHRAYVGSWGVCAEPRLGASDAENQSPFSEAALPAIAAAPVAMLYGTPLV